MSEDSTGVVYGSAALDLLDRGSNAVAEELCRRLAPMRTSGFEGSFTVLLTSGPILVVEMNLKRKVRMK